MLAAKEAGIDGDATADSDSNLWISTTEGGRDDVRRSSNTSAAAAGAARRTDGYITN